MCDPMDRFYCQCGPSATVLKFNLKIALDASTTKSIVCIAPVNPALTKIENSVVHPFIRLIS